MLCDMGTSFVKYSIVLKLCDIRHYIIKPPWIVYYFKFIPTLSLKLNGWVSGQIIPESYSDDQDSIGFFLLEIYTILLCDVVTPKLPLSFTR